MKIQIPHTVFHFRYHDTTLEPSATLLANVALATLTAVLPEEEEEEITSFQPHQAD